MCEPVVLNMCFAKYKLPHLEPVDTWFQNCVLKFQTEHKYEICSYNRHENTCWEYLWLATASHQTSADVTAQT